MYSYNGFNFHQANLEEYYFYATTSTHTHTQKKNDEETKLRIPLHATLGSTRESC